jgi:hypothetical protein
MPLHTLMSAQLMAILRLMAFMPIAGISAIVSGAIAYYLVNCFGPESFNVGGVVPWIASGVGSSVAFLPAVHTCGI